MIETGGEDFPSAGLGTPSEVAQALRTTPGQLARLRSRGLGPRYARLNGRSIRYFWEDVHKYVDNSMQETTEFGGEA